MISANMSCEPPSQIVPQICKCIIIAGTKNFQEQYYHFNGEFNFFACVHFCAANIKLCPVNIESSFICISIYHEVDKKSHLEPFQLPLHLQCCTCHFTWRYQLSCKMQDVVAIIVFNTQPVRFESGAIYEIKNFCATMHNCNMKYSMFIFILPINRTLIGRNNFLDKLWNPQCCSFEERLL